MSLIQGGTAWTGVMFYLAPSGLDSMDRCDVTDSGLSSMNRCDVLCH